MGYLKPIRGTIYKKAKKCLLVRLCVCACLRVHVCVHVFKGQSAISQNTILPGFCNS